MSESYDTSSTAWDSGHGSFRSQRRRARSTNRVSHERAVSTGVTNFDLLPEYIQTQCMRFLIVASDVTGSMGEGPPTYQSKGPYMGWEVPDGYLGKENDEICLMAFGDAVKREKYALQVYPFASGKKLTATMKKLVFTGDGGGNGHEASTLTALYLLHNLRMPTGARPILIIFTDEKAQPTVTPSCARDYARVTISRTMTAEEIFANLRQIADVYVVQLHDKGLYGGASFTREVFHHWENLVGKGHVVQLPEKGYDTRRECEVEVRRHQESTDTLRLPEEHVVDVIFGILAKITGKIDYFHKELADRQDPWQVERVLKCLEPTFPKKAAPKARKEPEDVGPLL